MRVYPESHAVKVKCGKKQERSEQKRKKASPRHAAASARKTAGLAEDVDTEMKSGHAMLFLGKCPHFRFPV
jgi:hypothetical protein